MVAIGICRFYELVVDIRKAAEDKMRICPPRGIAFGAISEGFALPKAQNCKDGEDPGTEYPRFSGIFPQGESFLDEQRGNWSPAQPQPSPCSDLPGPLLAHRMPSPSGLSMEFLLSVGL